MKCKISVICRNLFRTGTVDLHNPHEDNEWDKLLDCTRVGKLGQLFQLQHIDTSVEGLGNELHGNVVDDDDEWD